MNALDLGETRQAVDAASSLGQATIKSFTPHFSVVAEFGIRQLTAEVSGPSVAQPLACLLGWYKPLDRRIVQNM